MQFYLQEYWHAVHASARARQSTPAESYINAMRTHPIAHSHAVPPKTLIVCLAQEPESYILWKTTRAKWNILEAIYDGPIDTVEYQASPVILDGLPTQENGGVTLRAVAVTEGDPVANVTGDMVALKRVYGFSRRDAPHRIARSSGTGRANLN